MVALILRIGYTAEDAKRISRGYCSTVCLDVYVKGGSVLWRAVILVYANQDLRH